MRKVMKTLIASSSLPEKDKLQAQQVYKYICVMEYTATVKVKGKTHKHKGLLGGSTLVDREWQVECYLLSLYPEGEVTKLTVKDYD